jgi:hypothetical protein
MTLPLIPLTNTRLRAEGEHVQIAGQDGRPARDSDGSAMKIVPWSHTLISFGLVMARTWTIRTVKEWLGHKDIKTTMPYSRFQEGHAEASSER